ncbi:unnamed protein product [Mesocestoides corti]|uniref:Transposase n=1 Tax=Mesocestoides corti TaxID=53468 RepID=A0A0R3U771_MESCO|nr:unnamed protein product [Mesocestoides corti]
MVTPSGGQRHVTSQLLDLGVYQQAVAPLPDTTNIYRPSTDDSPLCRFKCLRKMHLQLNDGCDRAYGALKIWPGRFLSGFPVFHSDRLSDSGNRINQSVFVGVGQ